MIACAAYSGMLGAGVAAAPPGRGRWLALAGTWTLAELLRWTWPFGGVPLANLAIGQVAGPLAPCCASAAACCSCSSRCWPDRPSPPPSGGRGGWAGGIAARRGRARRAVDGRTRRVTRSARAEVALVQGGGEQGTRKTDASVIEVFERHVEATELVEPPVDLVVWPEDVIDTDGPSSTTRGPTSSATLAADLDAPMIVGTVEGAGPDAFRNSAVLVDADGEVIDRYDKVHRVPFGEFVPFRSLLEPVAGDALPDRDAADRRAARPPRRARSCRAGRHADLVGDLLPRPHPRGRRGRRSPRAQPDQRRVVHRHDRADPAGRVVADARHRERPLGRPRSRPPASRR